MPIDIAFERHAGAKSADVSLRDLERELKDLGLPGAITAIEWNPETKLATTVSLTSNDGSYGLKAVYIPANDKKPDHIAIKARLADGVPTQTQVIFDLVLLDIFNYTREQ